MPRGQGPDSTTGGTSDPTQARSDGRRCGGWGRLDTIVVGVDGSAASGRALEWAIGLGSGDGTLHVVHAFSGLLRIGLDALQQDSESVQEAVRHQLEGPWSEPVRRAGRPLQTHLVDDDPADALIGIAAANDADLIVAGRHGAGRGRFLLGAVTARLLHRAELPVVVVDPGQPVPSAAEPGPVVACVGHGKASDAAVEWAADFAVEHAFPLHLFHVVGLRPVLPIDPPTDVLASYLGVDVALEWAQSDLDELGAELATGRPDLEVTTRLDRGWAIPAMRRASEGAELVVVGKRQLGPVGHGVLSPRIHRLVARSGAPIAVVPTWPEPSVADRPSDRHPSPLGLTTAEAERRRRAGLGNDVEVRTTRSVLGIVRANTLTRVQRHHRLAGRRHLRLRRPDRRCVRCGQRAQQRDRDRPGATSQATARCGAGAARAGHRRIPRRQHGAATARGVGPGRRDRAARR